MTPFTTTIGDHTFTAYTFEPVTASGVGDQLMNNDTTSGSFRVIALVNEELTEGFEVVPVQGWSVFNPNANNTWTVRTPGRNSARAAFIDNYNFDNVGQVDDLRPPALNTTNADSMFMAFDVAYKYYSASLVDTLSVLVSTDCGNTFTSVYKKWGTQLGTASTANFISPTDADWRRERIAVSSNVLNTGSVVFAIRNSNGYGNNIFIDNVNIGAIYKRDLEMVSIDQPGQLICSGNITPSVTIRNKGVETITGFKVSYSINGGAAQTTTVTGVNIATGTTTTVNLTAATVPVGNHSIRVYSWDPVSVSGTGDQYTLNDSLSKGFSFAGTVAAPLTEAFEGTFAPAGWSTVNPDASLTWQKGNTGRSSTGSAFMNNYNYSNMGQRDELVSPVIEYSGVDSVKLTFDLSAMTRQYPGSTAIPLDTLEVLVTKDCGNTFTSVYKKWGEDLQTVSNPNYSTNAEFKPTVDYQWRTETVDLTAFKNDPNVMLVFRNTSNGDNNIFVDNVSFTTRTLPEQLKQRGYLVLPTVKTNSFSVWHIQDPVKLRYISVYSSTGQLVHTQSFNGNAL
ncbi:MAG TPA: choice-of-anchor J domain-containing protein, partial [Chitinophagaceae bacterium]